MQDHNLDDLIVDTIAPKNSKTKNFLTILALAIVVLIIAIILTKIILKDPNAPISSEDNQSVYIEPDLSIEAITKEEVIEKPLVPTTEILKPELNLKPTQESEPKKTTNTSANQASEAQKAEETRIEREKEQALQKQERLKKAQEEARKAQVQKEARLTQEKAQQDVDNTTAISHPYFIQVGSFSKTPSERFLGVIKSSGFHYQITPTSSNGTKKLLIGPYANRTKATSALIRVKDRINKSAFIIQK